MSGRRLAVVGAGTMGSGIAHAAALAGFSVALTDSRAEALAAAVEGIGKLLAGGVRRGKLSDADRSAVAARLRAERDLPATVRDADVVIEAVVEDLAVKQRLFATLARAAPPAPCSRPTPRPSPWPRSRPPCPSPGESWACISSIPCTP